MNFLMSKEGLISIRNHFNKNTCFRAFLFLLASFCNDFIFIELINLEKQFSESTSKKSSREFSLEDN